MGSRSAGGKDSGGGHSHHRNNAFTPPRNHGGGAGYSVAGVATASASVASRSGAILVPSSSSSSQANNVPRLRPMTGLARADIPRNTATASASSSTTVATTTTTLPRGSRIVESAGYYQSILQSKITDIVQEIQRMQYETEMANPQSKPRMALQKKHDDLLSMVQKLEGQLADCNLAREHLRLGSSPSDIKNSTARIIANNKEKEKEIDGVFYKRKKVEEDIASVEAELKRRHAVVEEEASNEVGVTGGSIDLVEEYRTLVKQLEAITVETEQQEDETVLLRHKLKMMMKSNEDGGNEDRGLDSSQRKNQKKLIESMKKQLNDVEEDIELALMTENEARDYLLGNIDSVQSNTKEHEEESMQLEADVESLQEMHKKLLFDKIQGGTVKAYNKLLQKDAKLKQYLQEELPMLKAKLEGERSQVESNIELLRNDIREKERMLEMELPSNEEMELMKDEMAFTGKHLDANQETMALLHQQKKKRMEEVRVFKLRLQHGHLVMQLQYEYATTASNHLRLLRITFVSWRTSIHLTNKSNQNRRNSTSRWLS